MPLSIRKRLPLSYAGVALLAALILGGVLLLGLSDYYKRVEREYLRSNAQTMTMSLAELLEEDAEDEVVQEHLDNLAFLSQTKVTLLDSALEAKLSSASPGAIRVALAPVRDLVPDESDRRGLGDDGRRIIVVLPPLSPGEDAVLSRQGNGVGDPSRLGVRGLLPEGRLELLRSITGTAVLRSPATESAAYSQEVHVAPILSEDGRLLGYIQLSQGPAYAQAVVGAAASAWGVAAAVATVLAAATGWLMSRRVCVPLDSLHQATQTMAAGDLTARSSVVSRDELGDLARVFNMMAERTEQTVNTLRRFAADAAHEIHTPLTALRTNIELARQRTHEAGDRQLAEAEEQAKRLQDIASKLLALSRFEGAMSTADTEKICLSDLITTLGEEYASSLEQSGKRLHLNVAEGAVYVQGRRGQLSTALENLLDNASKFTPKGGLVTLALECRDARALVTVEDTGIGIAEEDLPLLFQRFHRGRNAAGYPGSGLGLAIVRAIAEEHGGHARAENLPTGSRFVLELPAA